MVLEEFLNSTSQFRSFLRRSFVEFGPYVRSCSSSEQGLNNANVTLTQCHVQRRFSHIPHRINVSSGLNELIHSKTISSHDQHMKR
jgi:hypothetical protein